ncbi:cupredoxin domain-containing protein [Nocardioides cynanchi]|uniref:cupredoxin domain-containing protein n=1 Tax=Nocardioides cynanchi TaxID=2558918 RepID=UPI0012456706|nr:plastocyanin/azurin family copper-binding protein [Nocardioides cynanchi]
MKNRLLNRPVGAALALALLLVPTAIGATAATAHAGGVVPNFTVLVGSETSNMAVQGQRFLPGDITINAGDTVTWQANSTEIHTVTFVDGGTPQDTPPAFNPGDASQGLPAGGSAMASHTYFNSGLLTTGATTGPLPWPAQHSYTLSFPDAGTFTYYCLVHGKMMRGVVHVVGATDALPYTQADIDADAAFQAAAINADGRASMAAATAASTNHKVFTGTDDGIAMTMRFSKHKVVIHKGDSVKFLNKMSMGAPHTVTFGAVPVGLALFNPAGNPANFRGGNLHSGIIGPGGKFKVTFNKVGRFHYVCALHQDMGMKGLVVVKP